MFSFRQYTPDTQSIRHNDFRLSWNFPEPDLFKFWQYFTEAAEVSHEILTSVLSFIWKV
jgi:hypothetical protein